MNVLKKFIEMIEIIINRYRLRSHRLTASLAMLIFSFIALSTATYAWIVASLNVSLAEASMTTRIYGNLSVAQGKYEDIATIPPNTFNKVVSFAEHNEYSQKEISSNGQVFYTWGITNKNPDTNKPSSFTQLNYSVAELDANQERDYIAQDFTFLVDEQTKLYLTSDSSISNVGDGVNISPAARVAFYEWDPVGDKYDFKYVWAPNTAQIATDAKSGNIKYVSDTTGTETTYKAYSSKGLPQVSGAIYDDEVYVENDTDGIDNYAPPVLSFTSNEPTLKTIQVRIWLEGTDASAVSSNLVDNKGKWKVDLRFSNGIKTLIRPYKETINGIDIQPNTLGLIPVTYDASGKTIVANVYNKTTPWFQYSTQKWANAVSVSNANKSNYINPDGSYKAGTEIAAAHINAHFVYIPRYSFAIRCTTSGMTSCFGTSSGTTPATTAATPGNIDIKFIGTGTKETGSAKYFGTIANYYTPSAFTFENRELPGIWVGKFETTGTASTPTIKPGITALRNQNVSNQFISALKFADGTINTTTGAVTFAGVSSNYGTSNANSHMAKLSEWEAIVYFTQSAYGTYTNGYANRNSSYLTGCGSTGGATSACNGWTTAGGQAASTTGNMYGIYDMSGGSYDRVMASDGRQVGFQYHDYVNTIDAYFTGFAGSVWDYYDYDDPEWYIGPTTGIAPPNTWYFEDSTSIDARNNGSLTAGWYSSNYDAISAPYDGDKFWVVRGNYYFFTITSKLFTLNRTRYVRAEEPDYSFRTILIPTS